MPTYEYACPACGIVEVFQSMSEKPITRCPTCKKRKVTRMVSGGAGLIFKGSGFWETDYNRSDAYKKQSKDEAPGPKAEPEAKPSTKAETKPATPAAPTTTGTDAPTKSPAAAPPTKPSGKP